MNFLSRSQQTSAPAYARDWAGYGVASIRFTEDEFEISATDIVQAYLHRYASFNLGQSEIAAKWQRLIAIKEIVEQARQTQFVSKDFDLLLFVGVGSVGNSVVSQVEYFTKLLAPAATNTEIAPTPFLTEFAVHERLAAFKPFAHVGNIAATPVLAEVVRPELGAGFTPSSSLTDIWLKSVGALAREAGGSATSRLKLNDGKEGLRLEFTRMLTDVLGMLGQQLRYESADGHIIQNGEFISRVQMEICDTFLILPSLSSDFLKLLKQELVAAVVSGWELRGAWGKLDVTSDGDLSFRLEPAKFVTDPEFVRARRVE